MIALLVGTNIQSALDPAGPQAARIATLWWFLFGLLGAIFIAVIGFLLFAVVRRGPAATSERTLGRNITVLTVGTVAILFGLVIVSVSTGKSISQLGDRKGIMTIEVTGNQWWWQFRYMNSDPSLIFTTANELHIPVGQPVTIRGTSNDVIHSFWVPNLHGKTDLIPSRVTQQTLEADFAGRFRGQCAEFCGMQHAQMAIWVIAEPRDQFNQWMKNQLQSAAPPSTPSQFRGQQVFLGNGCVLCHAIQGTSAGGQNAPDLTHLASRGTIAAGTLRNTRESLRHWITDPQQPKPGNHMATIRLDDKDVPPLLDYLESLK